MMDRKAISAILAGCEPDDFMAYADHAELGTAAVGPDGRKYIFTNLALEEAERKRAEATRPKPQQPAKRTRKPATQPPGPASGGKSGVGRRRTAARSKKSPAGTKFPEKGTKA